MNPLYRARPTSAAPWIFVLIFLLGAAATPVHGQPLADTTKQKKDFWHSTAFQIGAVPTVFFIGTAVSWPYREEVREFRNRYIPTFRHHYDDYLQYAPALTVFGLNAAGVKGKHKPKRAVMSYLFSVGISVSIASAIKYTAKVERPSGEHETNSFPSGHTTNAFMNATFLHKEYGQYRSPLYSVGGYTVATVTGISRELNNRHWISDVLAGAGIGILSTELAYLLADRIYKDKGNNEPIHKNTIPISGKPSFLEMRFGYARAVTEDLTGSSDDIYAKGGFNMGIEGAWFFSKNVGVGGEFAFTSFPMNSDNLTIDDPDLQAISTGYYTQPMGVRYLQAGPFFSFPLPRNWFITGKANIGSAMGARGEIVLELNDEFDEAGLEEIPMLRYLPEMAFSWSVGAGIQKRIGRNVGLKAYTSYFHSIHDFELEGLDSVNEDGTYVFNYIGTERVDFSHFAWGLAVTAYLW